MNPSGFDRWCASAVSGIRYKPDRRKVYAELYAHLEDRCAAMTDAGVPEDEAVKRTLEAMGIHREVIYLSDGQLEEKPLYRMAVDRSHAVRFLRERSDGRLIHNGGHAQRLEEYLRNA